MQLALAKYIIRTNLSDRSYFTLISITILTAAIAWFLGQTAIIETQQASLSLACEVIRLVSILGTAFLLNSFIARLHTSGEIQLWLAQPISRLSLILQIFSSSAVTLILLGFTASLFLSAVSTTSTSEIVMWALMIMQEGFIVVSLALLIAINFPSTLKSNLLLLVFYISARLKGFIIGTIDSTWLEVSPAIKSITKVLLLPLPNLSLYPNVPDAIYSTVILTVGAGLTTTLFLLLAYISLRKKCY